MRINMKYQRQASMSSMDGPSFDHPKPRCCCHPRAWGIKKGLRRARRRYGREIISLEMKESSL